MVKERKSRLDKGQTEFIGFGSFATTTTVSTSWAPVYTGTNEQFRQLFSKFQKRDETTISKAVSDFAELLQSDLPKKVKVEGLQHFAYMYRAKLCLDNSGIVRNASYHVWDNASTHLPKATTTLFDNHKELLGILYAAQVDADVSTSPRLYDAPWDWKGGLQFFTDSMLIHARPNAMDKALFPNRALNENQLDEIEERYVRIIGGCLDALTLCVSKHGPIDAEMNVWWKSLSSSYSVIRQKTYLLVAAVSRRGTPNINLTQILASEKDPANWSTLLEMTLSCLIKESNRDIIKALSKAVAKGCYGATVKSWGPILLPLLSKFGEDEQLQLLQAAQRASVVTDADQWELQRALSECSMYLLQQQSTYLARPVLEVWIGCLEYLLNNPTSHRTAKSVRETFRKELAQQLVKFQSIEKECAFSSVRDWFWDSGLKVLAKAPPALVEFLEELRALEYGDRLRNSPFLRSQFQNKLQPYQATSSSVPDKESYTLFLAIFEFCDPLFLIREITLEKFVFNDLLRWTILHTSKLSGFDQSRELVEMVFSLLSSCLETVTVDKRSDIWRKFLKEVIGAKCNIGLLATGLQVLRRKWDDSTWISCPSLEDYAEEIAEKWGPLWITEGVEKPPNAEELLLFYQVCLGSGSAGKPTYLVSDDVVVKWIEIACSPVKLSHNEKTLSPVLLEALLEAIKSNRIFPEDGSERILEQSWSYRGDLYETYTRAILSGNKSLLKRFVDKASKRLQSEIAKATLDLPFDEEYWVMKAARLLHLSVGEDATKSVPRIGLDDVDLWRRSPTVLFRASLALFGELDREIDRVSLLTAGSRSTADLADILLSLSEANDDDVQTVNLNERSSKLLSVIGGNSLDEAFKLGLFYSLLQSLHEASVRKDIDSDQESTLRTLVSTLSLVIGLIMNPIAAGDEDSLIAEAIAEGDWVWYITDSKNPRSREKARVAKVHHDAQTGYYFAISVDRDDAVQERQTVLERLRSQDWNGRALVSADISDEEWLKRARIRDDLLRVVCEQGRPLTRSRALAEVVAIIAGHVGLGKARGIGTPHYTLHRMIYSAQESLTTMLRGGNLGEAVAGLEALSLALGFGFNAHMSRFTPSQILSDPMPLTAAIMDTGLDETNASPGMARSVMEWFAVSSAVAKDEDLDTWIRFLPLVYRLISKSLEIHVDGAGAAESSIKAVACRAFSEAVLLAKRLKVSTTESLSELRSDFVKGRDVALSSLVGFFTDALSEREDDLLTTSTLPQLIDLCINDEDTKEALGRYARPKLGIIATALYHKPGRHSALLLVEAALDQWKPLDDGAEITLSDKTSQLLTDWIAGLDEEEASEIEEDVNIVAAWVPAEIMNELEGWAHNEIELLDESRIIGQSLIWITFLRCLEISASGEFRNRPAFVSYIAKCGALATMLNVSTLHADDLEDRMDGRSRQSVVHWESMLSDESLLNESNVATLTLFRTVEVLPALTRRWWDDECPKVYINVVKDFVEKHVSPAILSRELNRLKSTSSFGPMTVSASLVSRKVTATYVQDDFTLCVVITLPAAFPLRSAEVDCSKTLGVPQSRWKRWSMQIMLMLNSQGGSLFDALMLWKDNVDKEYAGVEPCPVCYSVLHVKTHKLPSLECTTCHNRFHVDCLTQWFRSSGKSQCVLCQQPWQGSRV